MPQVPLFWRSLPNSVSQGATGSIVLDNFTQRKENPQGDRHSHSRSCRKPYSDILAQTNYHYSEEDDSISEYNSRYGYDRAHSDSAYEVKLESGSAERYSPEPQHRRSRARSSRP
ncbi:unnamed protein product [Pleuronectes platessa]|uniref:Uncharacterized protein n=1 Tax=Pleuronectes platessa TaxID=8262 RepID=A0A9N7UM89_PLEPL|nr:unnamed protein product [Pleuronectes platessa]